MKTDINITLNKLIAYAVDNLLLDTLDGTYTLNRLAAVCGLAVAPAYDDGADYGDADIAALLDELAASCPKADKAAVMNVLFPMPRTVNYYYASAKERGFAKARDFLFDLYSHGYNILSLSGAAGKDGYLAYSGASDALYSVTLDVNGELVYTPRVLGNHIATLENPDIVSDDIAAREIAYVVGYGGAIAARVGGSGEYICCDGIALTEAPVKRALSSGAVKVSLLDYPVPALAFNGIAKNAVAREATKAVKAATEAGLQCVLAAAAKDGVTLYLVFATDVAADASGIICAGDALAACGVFRTADCSGVLSVLEKGTALSTDLAAFRPVYDIAGGVKLGRQKAEAALGGALVDLFKPALAASRSAEEDAVVALVCAE